MDCYDSVKVPIFLLNSTVDCVFLSKARYEQIIKRMWSLLLYVCMPSFKIYYYYGFVMLQKGDL